MHHDRYCTRGCGRHTVTWWSLIRDDQPDLELYLCGPHSDTNADALVAQGWVQVADERGTPQLAPTPAG